MLNIRVGRVRNALVRECMAEFLGTFVLLVSDAQAFALLLLLSNCLILFINKVHIVSEHLEFL